MSDSTTFQNENETKEKEGPEMTSKDYYFDSYAHFGIFILTK